MRGLTYVFGLWLLPILVAACDEGGSSSQPSGPIPVGPPPGGTCVPYTCTCENGLTGTFDCGSKECSCAACPHFAPPEPEPFEACGGEPTGFWRLSSATQGRFDLSISNGFGMVSTCHGQYPEPAGPHEFLLELKANGVAAVHYKQPSQQVEFASSCLSNAGASCSALGGFDCAQQQCGLCHCTVPADTADLEQLTWTADEGKLTLNSEKGSGTIPFCVNGDKLTYRAEGGTSLLTFERIYRAGEPQVCAERSVADCEKSGTCTLGQCVGTGSCTEAATEAVCAKYQNCAWDASSCFGNVLVQCTVSDYVNGTPGCVLSEKPPTCVGTPWACELQPGCEAPGCLIGPACKGGEQACDYDDNDVKGCVCDLSCSGTFQCADVIGQAACEGAGKSQGIFSACKWSTTACVATAKPCAELSLNECETTIGCFLQAP